MKFVPLLSVLLVIMFFSISCKDNTTDPKPDTNPPKDTLIYFSGLTMTDDVGNALNLPDASDWGVKDQWTAREAKLFANASANICMPDTSYGIVTYPNPSRNVFSLDLKMPADARFSFRLVDQQLKVVLSQDQLDATRLQINTSGVSVKDTLRMYYKFTQANCELRGHGDILLQ